MVKLTKSGNLVAMRLIRFQATGLNGYLDFDFEFNSDLNFLIGINGSGKTSVLKAVVSLLAPDVDWLFGANYKSISLLIHFNDEMIEISAEQEEDGVVLRVSEDDKPKSFLFRRAEYQRLMRKKESYIYEDDGEVLRLQEYQTETPNDDAVFQKIKQLPTPIFLGLDRTTLPGTQRNSDNQIRRAQRSRRPRSTIRTFLDESVAQAEALVVQAMSRAHRERARLANRLREDILLSLFAETPQNNDPLPTKDETKKLERTRRSLKTAFTVLGIGTPRIDATVDPFFSELIGVVEDLKSAGSVKNILDDNGPDLKNSFFAWISKQQRLSLLSHVENLVSQFNTSEVSIFKKITNYKTLMMEFFKDSKKELSVQEDGVSLHFPNGTQGDIYQTSSGERQLFVLLANLMFNEDEKQANVLIIDEPELSLHLRWQEMFVSSVQRANSDVQIILATHSPSIILNNDMNCIDLA